MAAEDRELTPRERALIARAREKAFVLYEGTRVAHRSCGIALAETLGLPTRPYSALRRGGLTGTGICGAIKGGELVLGELLGDPDPAGPVPDAMRAAILWYRRELARRLDRGGMPDVACDALTGRFGDFQGAERKRFCTHLVAGATEILAEALVRFGGRFEIGPIPER